MRCERQKAVMDEAKISGPGTGRPELPVPEPRKIINTAAGPRGQIQFWIRERVRHRCGDVA